MTEQTRGGKVGPVETEHDRPAAPPPGWGHTPWPEDQQIRELIWDTVTLSPANRAAGFGYYLGRDAGWRHAQLHRHRGTQLRGRDTLNCPYPAVGPEFAKGWAFGIARNHAGLTPHDPW